MLKLVLLIIFAILAIVAAMAGVFFKGGKNPKSTDVSFRKMVKFRFICYIVMMVILLILVIL